MVEPGRKAAVYPWRASSLRRKLPSAVDPRLQRCGG